MATAIIALLQLLCFTSVLNHAKYPCLVTILPVFAKNKLGYSSIQIKFSFQAGNNGSTTCLNLILADLMVN
jgi:hypothetical protein